MAFFDQLMPGNATKMCMILRQRASSRSQTALRTTAGMWRELLGCDAAECSRSGLECASELEDWLGASGAGEESAAAEGSGAGRVPFAGSGPMTLEVSVTTERSSAAGAPSLP